MQERIAPADQAYLTAAMVGLEKAQFVVAFVQSVLVKQYGLTVGDQIHEDGTIERIEQHELAPTE